MSARRFDLRAPGPIGHAGRGIVIGYVCLLVVLPLAALVARAVNGGLDSFIAAITASDARDALALSFGTSLVAALVQAVLGTATAFLLVRSNFRGKKFVSALVDLPLAMPTLVAGVMLVLLFGPGSPLGRFLAAHGVEVVYTRTAIVLALLFVTFPFVVRAVEPVLLELDPAEEEAAKTLGASAFLTFRSVIFPAIAGAALSGSIRAFARALAEFGSLVVVSGNVPHETLTAPVQIFGAIESGRTESAVAVSLVILSVAVIVVGVARFIERRLGDRHG